MLGSDVACRQGCTRMHVPEPGETPIAITRVIDPKFSEAPDRSSDCLAKAGTGEYLESVPPQRDRRADKRGRRPHHLERWVRGERTEDGLTY